MKILNPLVRLLLRTISPLYRPGARIKVVLFHHARSGSTVINSMLRQHTNVYWAGEILRKKARKNTDWASFDYQKYLSVHEFASIRPVYGIEIKFSELKRLHIPIEDTLMFLRETGYQHIIILERLNTLRQMISLEVMKAAGFAHLSSSKSTRLHRVRLTTTDLVSKIDQKHHSINTLKNLLTNMPHLVLTYETDIQNDPSVAYRKICDFIGISPLPVSPKLTRINPFPIAEILLNFDEVAIALQNTPHAWMLKEYD